MEKHETETTIKHCTNCANYKPKDPNECTIGDLEDWEWCLIKGLEHRRIPTNSDDDDDGYGMWTRDRCFFWVKPDTSCTRVKD